MTVEEAYADWADLDPDERVDALQEAADDALTSAGYDPVDVSYGGAGASASTHPDTGNISFDPDYLADGEAIDVFQTLYHEVWHVMDVQDGVIAALPEDQQAAFNDSELIEGYYDDEGELRETTHYVVPEHDNAEVYSQTMANALRDAAQSAGSGGTAPPAGGGAGGAESAADGFQVEIDWANVVVTSVPSVPSGGDPPGAAEYYEGGHAVPSP